MSQPTKKPKVLVAGTRFGGFTAALKLKEFLHDRIDVQVVADSPSFLFTPSLIWVPFGERQPDEISFDVRPVYEKHGVEFTQASIEGFDPPNNVMLTADGEKISYDYLIIATGPTPDVDAVPGLRENSHSIMTLSAALRAKTAWDEYLKNPGPIVVGACEGAACFGAAYEFLFNARYQLAKHGLDKKVTLTYVTAEPFLTHFGIGGFGKGQAMCEAFFKLYGIEGVTNTRIEEVGKDYVQTSKGKIASAYSMIVPPFLGISAIRNTPDLGNARGFLDVSDEYQHPKFKNIYAAGVATQVDAPSATELGCGVPKTGYPTEQMATIAAWNIASEIDGRPRRHLPFGEMKALCVMDTGNMGMMILGDHMLPPREHEAIIPGPQAHWTKVAFEKYYLASRKRGHV